jgi:alpha-1,2-mannosyltransferase
VRVELAIAGGICAAIGLYDILYLLTQRDGAMIGPRIGTLFPDFLTFHAASIAWAQGQAALIYDSAAFTHFQNAVHSDRYMGAPGYRPFFYPPIWLLMLLPLCALGVTKAYGAFMCATAALATALVGRHDWRGWLAILVSPAAVWVIVAGQNTFLSVALLYGGFRLLKCSPASAGVLLGLLAYKPQLWVLVPIALLAARQWRALAWMAGTVAAMSLASLAVFGPEVWDAFLVSAREGSTGRGPAQMFDTFRNQIVTAFAAARIVGLPASVADTVQLVGAILAATVVWVAFRRYGPSQARTALLAAATFLVGPYTMNYDLLLLMPAVVALFRLGATEGFYPGERFVYLLLWLLPTLGWILNQLGIPIMPLAILLFGSIAFVRLQPWVAPGSVRV